MTTYTPNLNLDLYEKTDRPALDDQYNAAMNKLDTVIHDVQDDVTANANDIKIAQRDIKQNTADIVDMQEDVENAVNATKQNASNISKLQTSVNENSTKIQTLTNSVQDNTLDISSLKTTTATLTSKVSDIENDISSIESTVASKLSVDNLVSLFNFQNLTRKFINYKNTQIGYIDYRYSGRILVYRVSIDTTIYKTDITADELLLDQLPNFSSDVNRYIGGGANLLTETRSGATLPVNSMTTVDMEIMADGVLRISGNLSTMFDNSIVIKAQGVISF